MSIFGVSSVDPIGNKEIHRMAIYIWLARTSDVMLCYGENEEERPELVLGKSNE